MRTIESEVELSSPPDEVWSTLTDFNSYPDWNPFLPEMKAQLGEGEPFKAMSRLPVGIRLGFTGRILSVIPSRELSWVGRPTMMPSSAMEVRHTFTLEEIDGGTRLHQVEEASGFMIPLSGWILSQAQKGQVALNEALDERLRSG